MEPTPVLLLLDLVSQEQLLDRACDRMEGRPHGVLADAAGDKPTSATVKP